jgi:hypothetical protein
MARIDARKVNLRVEWIDITKNQPVAQPTQRPAHPVAKEAPSRSEIFRGLPSANGSVGYLEHFFHGLDLVDESGIVQGSRGLIVHRMIRQLVSGAQ